MQASGKVSKRLLLNKNQPEGWPGPATKKSRRIKYIACKQLWLEGWPQN